MTAPSNVAVGDQITAAKWNALLSFYGGTPQTYTPTLTATTTNPTLGTGSTQVGAYIQVGDLVTGWVQIIFGTSGTAAGSGNYRISTPVNIGTSINVGMIVGVGQVQAAGLWTAVQIRKQSSTTFDVVYFTAATNGSRPLVTSTAPGAWTASDQLMVQFTYPSV